MSFPTKYRCLSSHVFGTSAYKLVPIRYDDRFSIMKWRNEQMYHLRQGVKLTEETQTKYFNDVVIKHFDESYPSQLLFSYLKEGKCVGYGGLVHINWIDKNAELSFIMATELERLDFDCHWANYLNLIEKIAFEEVNLYKMTTESLQIPRGKHTASNPWAVGIRCAVF